MKRRKYESSYPPDVLAAIDALERAERFMEIEGAYELAFREYKRRLPKHFAYIVVLILFTFPLIVAWQYYADTASFDPLERALISGAIVGVVLLVGQLIWRPSWAQHRLVRAVGKWKTIAYAHAQERRHRGSDAT